MPVETRATKKMRMFCESTPELPPDIWVNCIIPLIGDRSDWLAVSRITKEINNGMKQQMPPWPEQFRVQEDVGTACCSFAVSPNEEWIACGYDDGSIQFYHRRTGHYHTAHRVHINNVESMTFSTSHPNKLVSHSWDILVLWDLSTHHKSPIYKILRSKSVEQDHTDLYVGSFDMSPDGQFIVEQDYYFVQEQEDPVNEMFSIWTIDGRIVSRWYNEYRGFRDGVFFLCDHQHNDNYRTSTYRVAIQSINGDVGHFQTWDIGQLTSANSHWPHVRAVGSTCNALQTEEGHSRIQCLHKVGAQFVGLVQKSRTVLCWSSDMRLRRVWQIPEGYVMVRPHTVSFSSSSNEILVCLMKEKSNALTIWSADRGACLATFDMLEINAKRNTCRLVSVGCFGTSNTAIFDPLLLPNKRELVTLTTAGSIRFLRVYRTR